MGIGCSDGWSHKHFNTLSPQRHITACLNKLTSMEAIEMEVFVWHPLLWANVSAIENGVNPHPQHTQHHQPWVAAAVTSALTWHASRTVGVRTTGGLLPTFWDKSHTFALIISCHKCWILQVLFGFPPTLKYIWKLLISKQERRAMLCLSAGVSPVTEWQHYQSVLFCLAHAGIDPVPHNDAYSRISRLENESSNRKLLPQCDQIHKPLFNKPKIIKTLLSHFPKANTDKYNISSEYNKTLSPLFCHLLLTHLFEGS